MKIAKKTKPKIVPKELVALFILGFDKKYTNLELSELAEAVAFIQGMLATRMTFQMTVEEHDSAVATYKAQYQNGVQGEIEALFKRFQIEKSEQPK